MPPDARLLTRAGRAQIADELQAFAQRLHRVQVLPRPWRSALAVLRGQRPEDPYGIAAATMVEAIRAARRHRRNS